MKKNVAWPQNTKENVILALPNVAVMVCGMMGLNMYLSGALTAENFLKALGPMYVLAFVLDFFVAGPISFRIVRRMGRMKMMPVFCALIMAGIMTFVAPIVTAGYVMDAGTYATVMPRNYVVALAMQVLVAMPFSLLVFGRYKAWATK